MGINALHEGYIFVKPCYQCGLTVTVITLNLCLTRRSGCLRILRGGAENNDIFHILPTNQDPQGHFTVAKRVQHTAT